MTKKNQRNHQEKGWQIGISILLFLINAMKFINNPGSEVPIIL